MKNKHTPGNWLLNIDVPGKVIIYTDVNQNRVALCGNSKKSCYVDDSEEQIANARLIAAAPELLEALEMVLNQCDGVTNPPCYIDSILFRKVKDAILKAKGE